MKKEAKCIDCGKIIYIGLRASNKKCRCEECKLKYDSIKYSEKYKNGIKKSILNCNIFDNIKCEECYFKQHNICKSKSGIQYKLNTLHKYCNLNITDYNSTLHNYLEIKHKFQNLLDNGLSCVDICLKYFNNCKYGNTIFEILQLKLRTLSESVRNAFMQGKLGQTIFENQYKSGWHISWENNEYWLRSSYEFDYAKYLDLNHIKYCVENLRIKYWDSQRQEYRCAVPDFYLIETNTIVEIKSKWTLDDQNMKDKIKAYKKLGYNFKLICDHKEIELN